MNDSFVSVLDILEQDPSGAGLKPIREDLLNMDMETFAGTWTGACPRTK
jgi:hypothetical protein